MCVNTQNNFDLVSLLVTARRVVLISEEGYQDWDKPQSF